jgi:ribosomal-protein-alanine N-acetyltransferase
MKGFDDIASERLILRLLPREALLATAAGDIARVSRGVGLALSPAWSEVASLARRRLAQLETDPDYAPWGIRAIALQSVGEVVGYVNFHASPGSEDLKKYAPRAVELGYTIFAEHRRQGYAGETARAMMNWALARKADGFVFSISPSNLPSLSLVRRFNGVKVGSQIDEEDGPEDIYFVRPESVGQLI